MPAPWVYPKIQRCGLSITKIGKKALTNKIKLNKLKVQTEHICIINSYVLSQIKLVIETKGMEHALELKRIIERAYPCTSVFETEPFNDKRTCPCYVRKTSV